MKHLAFFALAVAICTPLYAGDCCAHCGCSSNCTKVCRVICETKKVTKPDYDCECEEFCVPGKSERCVTYDECGCRKVIYTPTCGEVYTRTKLIKRTKTEEVTSYRWVVEDLCSSCAARCAPVEPGAPRVAPLVAQQSAGSAVQMVGHAAPAAPSAKDDSGADESSPSLLRRALAPLLGRN